MDKGMIEHLEALPGTLSEHIREAVYQYLLKLKQQEVASSLSEKGGNNDRL
jgi:hypothetical protein